VNYIEEYFDEKGIDSAVPGAYNLSIAIIDAIAEERVRAFEYLNKWK
jgi:hypothetical protein